MAKKSRLGISYTCFANMFYTQVFHFPRLRYICDTKAHANYSQFVSNTHTLINLAKSEITSNVACPVRSRVKDCYRELVTYQRVLF